MATIKRFEDLEIWIEARRLFKEIIIISKNSDLKNDFKLNAQIKSASGSVMDNIAEGFERDSDKEFSHFLSIAKGSCGEVRSLLYASLDQNYINQVEFQKFYTSTVEIMKMISGLMRYMKNSDFLGKKYKKDSGLET